MRATFLLTAAGVVTSLTLATCSVARAGGLGDPVFEPEPVPVYRTVQPVKRCGFLGLRCKARATAPVMTGSDGDEGGQVRTVEPTPLPQPPTDPVDPVDPVDPTPTFETKRDAMVRAFGTADVGQMTETQRAERKEAFDARRDAAKADMANDADGDGRVDGREASAAAAAGDWSDFGK